MARLIKRSLDGQDKILKTGGADEEEERTKEKDQNSKDAIMKEQERVHAKGEVTEIESFSKEDGVEAKLEVTEIENCSK